jgi:hypothetical protein
MQIQTLVLISYVMNGKYLNSELIIRIYFQECGSEGRKYSPNIFLLHKFDIASLIMNLQT